jgi:hypothetical protein
MKDGIEFMAFSYLLPNNTVRSSNYLPSNYSTTNEGKTGKGMKGSGRGLL